MPVRIGTNGSSFQIGLPVLIMLISVVVSLAVAVSSKVDRERVEAIAIALGQKVDIDKVQACESRIVGLERDKENMEKSLDEMKQMLKELQQQQHVVLEKVTRIEGRQAGGG